MVPQLDCSWSDQPSSSSVTLLPSRWKHHAANRKLQQQGGLHHRRRNRPGPGHDQHSVTAGSSVRHNQQVGYFSPHRWFHNFTYQWKKTFNGNLISWFVGWTKAFTIDVFIYDSISVYATGSWMFYRKQPKRSAVRPETRLETRMRSAFCRSRSIELEPNHPCLRLQVHALQCDVRDPQAVSRCVDAMEKLTGLPDVKTTKLTHKRVGNMRRHLLSDWCRWLSTMLQETSFVRQSVFHQTPGRA